MFPETLEFLGASGKHKAKGEIIKVEYVIKTLLFGKLKLYKC